MPRCGSRALLMNPWSVAMTTHTAALTIFHKRGCGVTPSGHCDIFVLYLNGGVSLALFIADVLFFSQDVMHCWKFCCCNHRYL